MNPEEDDDRTVIRPRSARTGASLPSADAGAPPPLNTGEPPTQLGPRPTSLPTMAATAMQTPPASSPTTGGSSPTAAVAHHAIALPAGTRLAEFEVTSTIGEGGFGIVYLAWDHSLDRKVALKEYMPSSIAYRAGQTEIRARSERHQETFDAGMKSFINEAKLLAQFDHPSLLKVYRFWEANGTAYMVMPFLEGVTVRDTVRAMPTPPDEAWILGLLRPVCDALAMLHAVQVYHRDIAPDNILLLAETGRPLLLDFGAARRVIGDMTQALTAILKPGYAPVEQYADMPGLKQGPWTDVYALAAVAHWMILGKTPTPSVGRLFDDAYVPLAKSAAGRYSDPFLQAIDRALAVMPDKRTHSVEAFREDLLGSTGVADLAALPPLAPGTGHAAMAGQVATANADGTRPLPPAPPRHATAGGTASAPKPASTSSRKWLPFAIGGIVAAAVLVAAVLLWPKTSTTSTSAPTIASQAPVAVPPASAATVTETPTAVPVPEPVVTTPDAAAIVTPTPTVLPQTPAPVVIASPPAHEARPVAVKPVRPKAEPSAEPRTAEPRPTATRRAEPREVAPRATEAAAPSNNRDECAKLFQRLSIGDSDQGLIDRIRTLRCR
ncbi:MAG: protein kinase [Caldimonas sp.]